MLERLEADIKAALLAGDKEKARALAFIKNSLQSTAKDQSLELNDEACVQILRKEAKKRQEAAELFEKGGNIPSAEKERYELGLIENYLPAQASQEAIRSELESIITEKSLPKAMSSMGPLMGATKQKLGPEADPSLIARIASELLKGSE